MITRQRIVWDFLSQKVTKNYEICLKDGETQVPGTGWKGAVVRKNKGDSSLYPTYWAPQCVKKNKTKPSHTLTFFFQPTLEVHWIRGFWVANTKY